MSWMDDELDDLFREQSAHQSFEYKDDYWKEFEANHLNKKRDGGMWIITSAFFTALLLIGSYHSNQGETINNDIKANLAGNTKDLNTKTGQAKLTGFDYEEGFLMNGEKELESSLENHSGSGEYSFGIIRPLDYSALIVRETEEPNEISVTSLEIANASENPETELEVGTEDAKTAVVDESFANVDLKAKPLDENILNYELEEFKGYRPPKAFRWYLQGQMGVSQSMVTGANLASHAYGFGLGSTYNRGRLTASLGLEGQVSNHSELLLTRSSKIYGFGSQEYKADIDYSQLYQLGISASVGMRFNKTTLVGGFSANYLTWTKSYIYESTIETLNTEAPAYERSKIYGYMDGLNRLTTKVFVGTTREFSPSIEMGCNLGFQLQNSFDASVVKNLNRTPFYGQLFIRKTF